MRETRVSLNKRTEMPSKFRGDLTAKDDAMGISDRCGTVLKGRSIDIHVFSQDLSFLTSNRYLGTQKTHFSHFHRDPFPTSMHTASYSSAQGFYGEWTLLHKTFIPKITGKNAETISAFLSFTPIRVHDSEAEVANAARKGTEKNPIRSYAEVAITNELDLSRRKLSLAICRSNKEIIIPQSVVLLIFHILSPFKPVRITDPIRPEPRPGCRCWRSNRRSTRLWQWRPRPRCE